MQKKQHNIFGGFLWIIVVVAVGYGGFVAYERWWGTPEFKAKVVEIQDSVGHVLGSATEWVKKTVEQSAKQTAGDVIVSAGDSLGSLGEKLKTEGLDGSGVTGAVSTKKTVNPAASGGMFAPVIGLSAVVGAPISFFLISDPSYSVDWGDGKKEERTVSGKNGFSVSHRWTAPGRYEVVVTVLNGSQSSKDTFMVNITP